MLIGTIRPQETRTITLQGASLEDIREQAITQTPAGWDLVSAPVTMTNASTMLTATATLARRDGAREVEADDMDRLLQLVPDGWELLSVRSDV